jgi:diamine N-acetyltransferase
MKTGDESPIFKWENDTFNWEFGDTKESFSKEQIIDFVDGVQDIIINKQLRLMIDLKSRDFSVGCIDLFEFDNEKNILGVGILIGEQDFRNRGYAKEALSLIVGHCRNDLKIETLFCNIAPNNLLSIKLFENNGFQFIEKRDLFGKQVNYYELNL